MPDMPKNVDTDETFRRRCREEMDIQGKTISEVAEAAGISFVHLSRVLGGKASASLAVAVQIADALSIGIDELLDVKKIHA
jgi:transcriptional regulator with XRE-family HTH domain